MASLRPAVAVIRSFRCAQSAWSAQAPQPPYMFRVTATILHGSGAGPKFERDRGGHHAPLHRVGGGPSAKDPHPRSNHLNRHGFERLVVTTIVAQAAVAGGRR